MRVSHELLLDECLTDFAEADVVAADLLRRRDYLDERFNGFEGYELGDATVLEVTPESNDCLSVVVDISNHPGGAFKYASALGGVLTAPEGTHTVVMPSAGNYAGTCAEVCRRTPGIRGIAYVPSDCDPVKRKSMQDKGMEVRADFDSVAEAMPVAVYDARTLSLIHI